MAKDIGQVMGMVFMPSAPGDLFSSLWGQGIIGQDKKNRAGFNLKGVKKPIHSRPNQFLMIPDIISQKSSKTGMGSLPVDWMP